MLLQTAMLVSLGTNSSLECLCNAGIHHGLSEQLTNYSTSQLAKKAESYRSSELTLGVNTRACTGSLQSPWEESVPRLLGKEGRTPQLPTPLHRSIGRANTRATLPGSLFYWPCNDLSALSGETKGGILQRRKGFSSSNQAQPMPGNAVALTKAAGCQHTWPGDPWATGLDHRQRVSGINTTYISAPCPAPLAFAFGHGLRQKRGQAASSIWWWWLDLWRVLAL